MAAVVPAVSSSCRALRRQFAFPAKSTHEHKGLSSMRGQRSSGGATSRRWTSVRAGHPRIQVP
eukprot:1584845-Lingulodinium_polyedra.AAC.1